MKQQLSKHFSMKDVGITKKILGIRINWDKASRTFMLSQEKYIIKVLDTFNMKDAKLMSNLLYVHFKPSKDKSPETAKNIYTHMKSVPCVSFI